jgi:MSHA biogenesis protein MshJ
VIIQWQTLADKVAQLQIREKALIFFGILFVLLWLAVTEILSPMMDDIGKTQKSIANTQDQIVTAQQQIEMYQQALAKDPNVQVQQSINTVQRSISRLDEELDVFTADFISPSKMREVLIGLLKSESKVKVIKFNAVAAVEMDIPEIPQSVGVTLYQHGLKISISGNYFDLQRYMKKVELLPWRFYWQVFSYKVEKYPKAILEIEISTISNNERFIAI